MGYFNSIEKKVNLNMALVNYLGGKNIAGEKLRTTVQNRGNIKIHVLQILKMVFVVFRLVVGASLGALVMLDTLPPGGLQHHMIRCMPGTEIYILIKKA